MEESKSSLADKLANLLTPAPVIADGEIETDDITSAKVVSQQSDDEEPLADVGKSQLRTKVDPLLGDVDTRYAGKTVSRKAALGDSDVEMDEEDDDNEEDEDDGQSEGSQSETNDAEGSEMEDEKDSGDEMDPEFKKILIAGDDEEVEDEKADEEDDDDEGSVEHDVKDDEESGDEEGEKDDKDKEEKSKKVAKSDSKSEEKKIKLFEKKLQERLKKQQKEDKTRKEMLSKAQSEKSKGETVKRQLKLWDSLLEVRIRLQKGLGLVNQLPQNHDQQAEGESEDVGWEAMVAKLEGAKPKLERCQKNVQAMSQAMLRLQTLLLKNVPETKSIVKATKSIIETKSTKSMTEADIEKVLAKRHSLYQRHRDETLTKWQEKTQITSAKSFHAFDTPILEQINLILGDKERLLTRTRTNRMGCPVIGKKRKVEVPPDSTEEILEDEVQAAKRKRDQTEGFQVDEDIFDDSDFYQHLLRELIERKTSHLTDSDSLGKQLVQLHKLRVKNKRKVDTRASKGRKVRHDTHKKLIGFTASTCSSSLMPDSARDELFKSLFGQRWTENQNDSQSKSGEVGEGKTLPQEE